MRKSAAPTMQGYGSPNPSPTGNALIDAFNSARAPAAQQAIAAAQAEVERHKFEFEQLKEQHDQDIAAAHQQYLQDALAQQAQRDAGVEADRKQAALDREQMNKDRVENQGLQRFGAMQAAGLPNGVAMANLPSGVRVPMVEAGVAQGNQNNFVNALQQSPAQSLPPTDTGSPTMTAQPQPGQMPDGMQGPPMQASPTANIEPGMAGGSLMEPAGGSAQEFTEGDFNKQLSPAFQAKVDKEKFDEGVKRGAQDIALRKVAEYEQRGADNIEYRDALLGLRQTHETNQKAFNDMRTAHSKFMEGISQGRLDEMKKRTTMIGANNARRTALDPLLKPYLTMNTQFDKRIADYKADMDKYAPFVVDPNGGRLAPPPAPTPGLVETYAAVRQYQQALGGYEAARTKLIELQYSPEYKAVKEDLPAMLQFKDLLSNRQVTTGGGAVKPSGAAGKPLDATTAKALLKQAGGDKQKARDLARQQGYQF